MYGICNVFDHLICWLGIVYSVCISYIVQRCLVWGLMVVCVKFSSENNTQVFYKVHRYLLWNRMKNIDISEEFISNIRAKVFHNYIVQKVWFKNSTS